MDSMDVPSPTAEAPPAYEFSQQEFDQKVTRAVERSLETVEQEREQRKGGDEGDVWEEWNDEAYQEAARQLAERYGQSSSSSGAGSSTQPTVSESTQSKPVAYIQDEFVQDRFGADAAVQPTEVQSIRPLSIQKKNKAVKHDPTVQTPTTQPAPAKERPSWYEEAQLGDNSCANPPQPQSPAGSRTSQSSIGHHPRLNSLILSTEGSENDHSIPPPPFAAMDNSLDGPAYERYPSNQRRQSGPQVVLRYAGDLSASPPPSPPQSPVEINHRRINPYDPRLLHQQQQQQRHRSPPPPQGRPAPRPAIPRPRSSQGIKGFAPIPPHPPRLEFDASTAYGKSLYGDLPAEAMSTGGGAAALYNSSVASLMPNGTNRSLQPSPQPRRFIPSMMSSNSSNGSEYSFQSDQSFQSFQQQSLNTQSPYDTNRYSAYSQSAGIDGQFQPRPGFAAGRPVSSLSQGDQPRWAMQDQMQVQQQHYYPR